MASTEQRLARLRQLQPAFIKWESLQEKQLPDAQQRISELQRKSAAESAVVSDLQEELEDLERQLQVCWQSVIHMTLCPHDCPS